MARMTVLVPAQAVTATFSGAGSLYPVKTAGGDFYWVYIDNASDVMFVKSTDGGMTWGAPTTIFTGTAVQLSVWYDRWSGIAAGLIHCAYSESGTDDVLYRTINTESADALSTQTVIFAGASTANPTGSLSIARARGGNVLCAFDIDGGTEHNCSKLVNANVPDGAWADVASPTEAAASDYMIMMPGWASDQNDMMMFFWDASADEISRKLYDDSGDAWAETSIAGTMVELVQTTAYPQFAAAVDITNSRNLLVAWSAADLLNADLRCWHVTESAITEVTNVVANSTDDQGLCGIGIDTDTEDWYVFYGGSADGADTFQTQITLRYKVSTDDGATWGAESVGHAARMTTLGLWMTPRFDTESMVMMYHDTSLDGFIANIDVPVAGGPSSGGAHILGGTVVR
jgi:hypothetical protein